MKLLADVPLDVLQGIGEIGQGSNGVSLTNKFSAFFGFRNVISLAIGVMTVVGFIWFFFLIITAAITWLGSSGEKNKIQEAQKRITNAIIGLILLISGTFLVKVVGTILGIEILRGVFDILPW